MASMTATEARDAYGRRFALLCHPWVSQVSTVLTTAPDGAALVDPDQVDNWVAHWGAWLAALANEPSLVGASVVVDAAPDPGTRLRHEVLGHRSREATALSRTVLEQVIEDYPTGSAAITCRVTLTWSMASRTQAGKKRSVDEMALDIGHRLGGLTTSLAATGAGPSRPMTVGEVAAAVRVAYEPALTAAVEDVGPEAAGVEWENAGPGAAQESWDRYRHDGAISMSWMMSEAPRGHVFSGILASILAPHPDIARKRVALLYRPYDTAGAVRVVESDRRDAIFAASGRRIGRARDALSVQAAERSAEEEAIGAGVVRFGMVVTATVLEPQQLPLAASVVDTLATSCRIRLRRAYGCQAGTFAIGLPLGLIGPSHLPRPSGSPRGDVSRRAKPVRPAAPARAPKPSPQRRPGPRGWPGVGGGKTSLLEAPPEWRATTVQVCGLWPWIVGSGAPIVGVPLGRHLFNRATVCSDPINWFSPRRVDRQPERLGTW